MGIIVTTYTSQGCCEGNGDNTHRTLRSVPDTITVAQKKLANSNKENMLKPQRAFVGLSVILSFEVLPTSVLCGSQLAVDHRTPPNSKDGSETQP